MNTRARSAWSRLAADRRGSSYTELVVAWVPTLVFFLGLYMLGHMYLAHLVIERAASAAARAAVVFLPDGPEFYPAGQDRLAYVHEAARRVSLASAQLGSVQVKLTGAQRGFEPLTAQVSASFDCSGYIVGIFCGFDRRATVRAEATLAYQQGPVGFAKR